MNLSFKHDWKSEVSQDPCRVWHRAGPQHAAAETALCGLRGRGQGSGCVGGRASWQGLKGEMGCAGKGGALQTFLWPVLRLCRMEPGEDTFSRPPWDGGSGGEKALLVHWLTSGCE